jgi:hypothetical protein
MTFPVTAVDGVGIRCAGCGKYIGVAGSPEIQQPKQPAKNSAGNTERQKERGSARSAKSMRRYRQSKECSGVKKL